jgi:FMN phosphatase YigB (HAD superfamily)
MKNKIVLLDIDYTLFDTKTFKDSSLTKYALYDEILAVLPSLAKFAQLGIFSKGEDAFQNAKLKETGIKEFFQQENVHVFKDKDANLKKVIEQYKDFEIYLIDDKLVTLYNAKTNTPSVFTVWIKRGPFAEDESLLNNFSPDAIVVSLKEIIPIVTGNFE